jgi:hypothetical protein
VPSAQIPKHLQADDLESLEGSCGIRIAIFCVMSRQRIQALVGETARELGILVVVFAPLESALAERPLGTAVLIGIAGAAIVLIACGILMEASD